ncbi:MAG TPA: hypothetical protein VK539_16115 [Myxococcaceae bacterium]|nr:hypothetical protein [Myxococcaceae bacterium]
MTPLLLLTAWLSASPAQARPDAFTTWFDSRVKEESAQVLLHERLDLDGDGRGDHLVCYVLPRESGTSAPVVLVGLSTGERFAFSGGGLSPSLLDKCPEPPTPEKRGSGLRPRLTLKRSGITGYVDQVSVELDRTGPLLAQYSAGDRYMRLRENPSLQSREYDDHVRVYAGEAEEPESYESAAIVATSSKAQARSPVSTWVSWGQANHDGESDAALQVTASHAKGFITVRLQVTDDKDVRAEVPAAAGKDKAVLAADHIELWWVEDTHTPSPRTVQLGAARDAQGKPVSVWFQAPEPRRAPPAVRWSEDNVVEVDLRADWLFPPPVSENPEDSDFTAVFSDSDGNGQETLVSTTDRRPTAENLGLLYLAAEKQRLPRLSQHSQSWTRLGPESTLGGLVREW